MEAAGLPLTASFPPKLVLRVEVRNGRYRVKQAGNALQSHPLFAYYFGHLGKSNLFLEVSIEKPLFCGRRAVGTLLQGEKNHAQHLVPGGGFAGPDFELAGCLMGEHFNSGDDLRAPFLGQLQETSFPRIVNHIKYIAGIDLGLLQGCFAGIAHPNRGGVNDDVESQLLQICALNEAGPRLVGEFLGGSGSAIQNINFRPSFFEAKNGRAGGTAGTDHQDAGSLQSIQTAFEGADDARSVGIKAVELAILCPYHGVAGADLGGVRVGVVEMRQNSFFVRHRHADAVDGNLPHAGQQVLQRLGVKREVDGVNVLPTKGRVHDGRGQRVRDGVAHNSVDSRSHIDSIDAINIVQVLRGYLAGGGLFSGNGGCEGEDASGPHAENAADNALFPHAHANQGVPVALPRQKLDHGDVVGERGGGADDLVEVGRVGEHFFQSLVQLLGGTKVMEGENEGAAGAKLLELFWLALACGLQFNIDQLATGGGSFAQNV